VIAAQRPRGRDAEDAAADDDELHAGGPVALIARDFTVRPRRRARVASDRRSRSINEYADICICIC
jgi:hypothetical protein